MSVFTWATKGLNAESTVEQRYLRCSFSRYNLPGPLLRFLPSPWSFVQVVETKAPLKLSVYRAGSGMKSRRRVATLTVTGARSQQLRENFAGPRVWREISVIRLTALNSTVQPVKYTRPNKRPFDANEITYLARVVIIRSRSSLNG